MSFAIYRIEKIRHLLDRTSTETLIHAFITSRLDYCNSMLYAIPDNLLNRLQLLQNSAARLVSLTRKHEHITPVLFPLHWLPIYQRIKFKILLLTYKALNKCAPRCIAELISVNTHNQRTRHALTSQRVLWRACVSSGCTSVMAFYTQ